MLRSALERVPKSLLRFVIAGGLTVLVDAVVYAGLLVVEIQIDIAKTLSLTAATAFAYLINKYWTFQQTKRERGRLAGFLFLYGFASGSHVFANWLMLRILGENESGVIAFAWFVATALSASINYIGMKFVVFRE